MSWTGRQWDVFAGLVAEAWHGDFDEAENAWRILLDGVDPAEAKQALQRLLLEGREHRPSVSEFLAEIRRDRSQPTFDEAFELIFGRRGALKADATGTFEDLRTERAARRQAILERAQSMHPLIASFIIRQSVERLLMLDVHDPEWGEKRRRDMEGSWDRHVEAFDGREVAAIAAGAGASDLRALDPLAALGIGTPPKALTAGAGDKPHVEVEEAA